MASFVDVTDHRRAEQEVRRTRDLLRFVVDSSPDWIFAKDFDHRFLLVNRAFADAQGCTPEQMLGRLDREFWSPELVEGNREKEIEGFHHDDRRAFRGETVHNPYDPATLADGRLRILDTVKAPLRDERGTIYGVLCYSRDVTSQWEADLAQKRAIQEREVLLKEIHHRVKNNLQIISSLLHFQSKKARTPEDLSVFVEGRNRLLAMTLVHEKLYRSRSLSRIDFPDYLRSLVGALSVSFENRNRIDVEVSADEDVEVSIERALAGGMIVCELVTNAFKYAFPDGRAGHIRVGVRKDGPLVLLQVDDDGVGYPEGFDPASTGSFGFNLVRSLAVQHDASVSVRSDGGAHVTVAFSVRDEDDIPAVERERAMWSGAGT